MEKTIILSFKQKFIKIISWLWVKPWRRLTVIAFLFLLILSFFLWPIMRRSWLDYPADLRLQIAWKQLAISWPESEQTCREDCSWQLAYYEQIITRAWSLAGVAGDNFFANQLAAADNPTNLKIEIINLWVKTGRPVDQSVLTTIFSDNTSKTIKDAAALAWPDAAESRAWQQADIARYQDASTVVERLAILNSWPPVSNRAETAFLWTVVRDSADVATRRRALVLIANAATKTENFSLTDIGTISAVLVDRNTPLLLKDDLIGVLSDYYQFFPTESQAILVAVASDVENYDALARALAIDILNRRRNEQLALPADSEIEAALNNRH
jgi:hypothetical protein